MLLHLLKEQMFSFIQSGMFKPVNIFRYKNQVPAIQATNIPYFEIVQKQRLLSESSSLCYEANQ